MPKSLQHHPLPHFGQHHHHTSPIFPSMAGPSFPSPSQLCNFYDVAQVAFYMAMLFSLWAKISTVLRRSSSSNSLRGRYFRLDFHRDCYVLLLASALTGYFCLGKCRSSGIFALENSTIETLFCLILSDAFRLLSKGTTFCHIQSPAYPALVDYFSYFSFGAKFCGTQIKRTSSKLWSGTVELENSMLRCGGVWGSIDAG